LTVTVYVHNSEPSICRQSSCKILRISMSGMFLTYYSLLVFDKLCSLSLITVVLSL